MGLKIESVTMPWQLCNSPTPTSAHILNRCQEALIQGQYTWRHDSVLNCLLSSVRETLSATSHLYADIPIWRASESPPATIPTNISTTRARPDMVLIEDLSVNLLELTIPTNTYEALQLPGAENQKNQTFNSRKLIELGL